MAKLLLGVTVIAACHSSPRAAGDAALEIDAEADAAPDAPAVGVATVTYERSGHPTAGIDLEWNDPSGAPLSHTTTDANGKASLSITAGSSATVFDFGGGIHGLMTVLDVQPGDDIVLGTEIPDRAADNASVSVQIASAFPGASYYTMYDGCNETNLTSGSIGLELPFGPACIDHANKINVAGVAFDAANKPLAFATLTGLTPPASFDAYTLPAWRTDFAQLHVTATNAPAFTTAHYAGINLLHDGVSFGSQSSGAASATFSYMTGLAKPLLYQVEVDASEGAAGRSAISVVTLATAPPATDTIDFATTLPLIHDLVIDVPTGETTPRLTWKADGDTTSASGGMASLYWDVGPAHFQQYVLLPPHATGPVQLPRFPTDLVENRVAPGQAFSSTSSLELIESAGVTPAMLRTHWSLLYSPDAPDRVVVDSSTNP